MTTHTDITSALCSLIETVEITPDDDCLVVLEDCDSPDVFGGTTLEIPGRDMRQICRRAFGRTTTEIPYETCRQVIDEDRGGYLRR